MPRLLDAIWLIALFAVSTLWYADRSVLAHHLRNFRIALEIEKDQSTLLQARLADSQRNSRQQ